MQDKTWLKQDRTWLRQDIDNIIPPDLAGVGHDLAWVEQFLSKVGQEFSRLV